MSSDKKKFLKGVTSGYAYMIVSMAVSLWMVPFVLGYLTKPEYGIFAIAGDLLGWLGVANLGITSAFNAKGAQLLGTNNREELNIVTSTTFFAQLATSLVIIVGGLLITLKPELLFGSRGDADNLGLVVAILVGGFFIQYITQPLNSLLVADKQIHIDNYLRFGLLAIQTTLTVLLLMGGMKLLSLAISSFVSNVIITAITWYRVKRSFPYIRFSLNHWRTDRMLFLLKNGIWFTVGGIAGILIFRMDAFLIGKYLSLSLVASFVINNRLYQIAEKFHGQFFNTARPYFAQTYGKGDMAKLTQMYNLVYYSSFLFAFVIGVGVYLVSKWFIGWWVGPDFYLGDTLNLLLCINFIVQAAVLPNRILLATSLHKIVYHNLTRIFEGITKFTLSIIFISQIGIKSIIIAAIAGSLFFSNSMLNFISAKFLNEKFMHKLLPLLPVLSLSLLLLSNNLLFRATIIIALLIILSSIIFYRFKHIKFSLKEIVSLLIKSRN